MARTAGGRAPAWSHDGSELYYVSLDMNMMAVTMDGGDDPSVSVPEVLFSMESFVTEPPESGSRPYEVDADGRFLLLHDPQLGATGTAVKITVVVNWFEELERLVPRR